MPKPNPNEEKSAFIARCVSHMVRKEGKSQDQALGACYGIWSQGTSKPKLFDRVNEK